MICIVVFSTPSRRILGGNYRASSGRFPAWPNRFLRKPRAWRAGARIRDAWVRVHGTIPNFFLYIWAVYTIPASYVSLLYIKRGCDDGNKFYVNMCECARRNFALEFSGPLASSEVEVTGAS